MKNTVRGHCVKMRQRLANGKTRPAQTLMRTYARKAKATTLHLLAHLQS